MEESLQKARFENMILILLFVLAVVFGLAIAGFVAWAILSERKKEGK